MLQIILLILKILGIILLIAAVILLAVLLAVLSTAAKYRIRFLKNEGIKVSADVRWLLGIVTVHFRLDNTGGINKDLRVCLFGFPIIKPFEEKQEKSGKTKKKKKGRPKKEQQKIETEPIKSGSETESAPAGSKGHAGNLDEPMEVSCGEPKYVPPMEDPPPGDEDMEKRSPRGRIRSIFGKISGIAGSIRERIRQTCESVRRLKKKKDDFLEFWNLPEHGRARKAIWKEAVYLLKKLRPRKAEGKVHFGFSDPSLTGKCMGAASVLYGWYPKNFSLLPDFEHEVMEGELWMSGYIRFYVLACILWRVWFNKDIRHMYHSWKEL